MAKKIGIICAIVIVLAGVFCLYQFTDVFGLKQEKPAATEAAVAHEAADQPCVGGADAVVVVQIQVHEGAYVDLELLICGDAAGQTVV